MLTTILLSGFIASGLVYLIYIVKQAPVIEDPDNVLSNSDISINSLNKKEKRTIREMKMPVYDNAPRGNDWQKLQEEGDIEGLVKDFPKITYQVRDIEAEIKKHGLKVVSPPVMKSRNAKTVVVELNGETVELIEITRQTSEPDPID